VITIVLPWPPKELGPNARTHWRARTPLAKKYRKDCGLLAMIAARGLTVPDGNLRLCLEFVAPCRRHRDDDNLIASFKAGRDGIADGLGINDKRFKTEARLSNWVTPGGQVIVTIKGVDA
jgi:crossover junction endodeoxyribonuclease RusA